MDPATSLGVASSAISLIEFACKIISITSEIRRHGEVAEVKELKVQAREMETMHNRLCGRNRTMAADLDHIYHAELAIDATIDECTEETSELIASLTNITMTSSISSRVHFPKEIKLAFKSLWEKDNMQQRVEKLQQIRLKLNSQIMVLLNEKIEGLYSMTGEKLTRAENIQEDLRNGQRKILEAITFTEDQSHSTFTGSDKPVAVILRFDDGEVKTMNRHLSEDSEEEHDTDRRIPRSHQIVKIGTTTTFRSDNNGLSGPETSAINYAPLARSVLDALYFSTFKEREERVSEAHQKTFQWILKDNEFVDFLDNDSDFYWITGKPGSGKSTLVKFIHHQPFVRQRLLRWAGTKTLAFASFYFWNAGTSLQKSQVGLLRSMLLSVLRACQHLIPTVFPELCRLYNDLGRVEPELSLSELKAGFLRLTSGNVPDLKFCFLIDGLDEYSGDPSELCDFLSEAARSSAIKFVVASRPWGVFTESFDRYPFIRMQDLTQNDIRQYTEDALVGYLSRRVDQEEELQELSNIITQRASGVFLWVVLVMRELRRGLQSHDDVSDLHRRLDAFPTDLKDYYRYMYNKIDAIHRPKCSKVLLTLLRSKELPVQGLLSVMQMSFSESETIASAVNTPRRRLEEERWIQTSEISKQQIENKTLGLVDVDVAVTRPLYLSTTRTIYADFLHRTVYDFFLLEGLQEEMKAEVPKDFDPDTTLLACYLAEIKAFPRQQMTALEHDRVISNAMNCLRLVRFLELEQKVAYPDVMKSIDESMNDYWTSIKEHSGSRAWAQAIVTEVYKVRWSHISPYIVSRPNYFLFLGVLSGCVLSVAFQAKPGSNVTDKERSQILSMLILRYFNDPLKEDKSYQAHFDIGNERSNFVKAIGLLLEYGADPEALGILSSPSSHFNSPAGSKSAETSPKSRTRENNKLPYCTPWEYFLDHVAQSTQINSYQDFWQTEYRSGISLPEAISILEIYQHFLNSNANLTGKAEKTLDQLNQFFEQSLAMHSHPEKRELMDKFSSEYQKTKSMVSKKRMRFVPRSQFRGWWDLQRIAPQDANGLSTSNIIIGILLLIITYLSIVSRD